MNSSLGAREGPGGKHEPNGMTHRSKRLEKRSMDESAHRGEQDCLLLRQSGSVYRRQAKGSLGEGSGSTATAPRHLPDDESEFLVLVEPAPVEQKTSSAGPIRTAPWRAADWRGCIAQAGSGW